MGRVKAWLLGMIGLGVLLMGTSLLTAVLVLGVPDPEASPAATRRYEQGLGLASVTFLGGALSMLSGMAGLAYRLLCRR